MCVNVYHNTMKKQNQNITPTEENLISTWALILSGGLTPILLPRTSYKLYVLASKPLGKR